jgi:hypothetical protein
VEAIPWQQFAAGGMTLLGFGAAAQTNRIYFLAQVIDLGLHMALIPAEGFIPGVDA